MQILPFVFVLSNTDHNERISRKGLKLLGQRWYCEGKGASESLGILFTIA